MGPRGCRGAFPCLAFVTGRLADGYAERAPYDLILIEGAVRAIPEKIGRQVAQNGRLVTVLAPAECGIERCGFGRAQRGRCAHAAGVRCRRRLVAGFVAGRQLRILARP